MKRSETASLLRVACTGGYALGAFNAVNLETAQGVVEAAACERTPVILRFTENTARHGGLKALLAVGRVLKGAAGVPVEIVSKGGREGENLTPTAIRDLAASSGCDAVAVNLGSKHKQTRKVSRLDLERLATIAALVPQPLVLHGSSGVTAGDLRRAVALGIAKVNVATELMQNLMEGVRESLTLSVHGPRTHLGEAQNRMREKARQLIRLLGRKVRRAGSCPPPAPTLEDGEGALLKAGIVHWLASPKFLAG